MRKSNKEFMPVWGWWVVVSFCLALVIGYLALTGTLHTAYASFREAMIPAHVIAEQKAQKKRYMALVDLSFNAISLDEKSGMAVNRARNLLGAFNGFKLLPSRNIHYLTDFDKAITDNAQWIQSISPFPPELAECRNLFVEMLVSMRKMRGCINDPKIGHDYYTMEDYQEIIFVQELNSLIDNSDRLVLKLPNVNLAPDPP